MGLSFASLGSNTHINCGDPGKTGYLFAFSHLFLPQKKDHNAQGSTTSSHGQAFFSKSLAEIYFPVRSPLGNK